ncbi:hypothetical protein D3C87_860720 [compost metagenome]
MRDEEQQEVLVPELREHAAVAAAEELGARVAHHDEGVAVAQVARVGRRARVHPEAVVAVLVLEVGQVVLGVGQVGVGAARAGDQREPHEVVAREAARVVQRQVGHHRHAVVLDLAVAQHAGVVRMVAHQRLHQVGPVRGDARCAVLGHVRQEGVALLRVGGGEHAAVGVQPLDAGHAVQGGAVGLPARRVGAAEAVEDVLRLRQAQVVGADLEVEQHHVDVEEEVQVAVNHVEGDRRLAGVRHQPHGRDVAAAEHAHRRIAVAACAVGAAARSAFAVQEALHVRQEAHELVVVALVEAAALAGVFVDLFAPGRGVAQVAQHVPGAVVRGRRAGRRHQAQGPEQRLPEMLHDGAGGRGACRGRSGVRVGVRHRASVGRRVGQNAHLGESLARPETGFI